MVFALGYVLAHTVPCEGALPLGASGAQRPRALALPPLCPGCLPPLSLPASRTARPSCRGPAPRGQRPGCTGTPSTLSPETPQSADELGGEPTAL